MASALVWSPLTGPSLWRRLVYTHSRGDRDTRASYLEKIHTGARLRTDHPMRELTAAHRPHRDRRREMETDVRMGGCERVPAASAESIAACSISLQETNPITGLTFRSGVCWPRLWCQYVARPPVMSKVNPVVKVHSSLTIQATRLAISLMSTGRPMGSWRLRLRCVR